MSFSVIVPQSPATTTPLSAKAAWWRRLDSNQRTLSERIYSPSPLTTRTLLHEAPWRVPLAKPARYQHSHLRCQSVRTTANSLLANLFSQPG